MTRRWRETWLFLKAQAVAFLAVGVDWATVAICVALHAHYVVAGVSGNVAGAITEFTIKRYVVFDAQGERIVKQAGRYVLVSAGAALINALVSWAVIGGFNLPTLPWIYVTSTVSGLIWTYPMHRYYVFPRGRAVPPGNGAAAVGIDKLAETRASPTGAKTRRAP